MNSRVMITNNFSPSTRCKQAFGRFFAQ